MNGWLLSLRSIRFEVHIIHFKNVFTSNQSCSYNLSLLFKISCRIFLPCQWGYLLRWLVILQRKQASFCTFSLLFSVLFCFFPLPRHAGHPYALMKHFGSSNQIISVHISHVNIPFVFFRLNNFLVTCTLLFIVDLLYMLPLAPQRSSFDSIRCT